MPFMQVSAQFCLVPCFCTGNCTATWILIWYQCPNSPEWFPARTCISQFTEGMHNMIKVCITHSTCPLMTGMSLVPSFVLVHAFANLLMCNCQLLNKRGRWAFWGSFPFGIYRSIHLQNGSLWFTTLQNDAVKKCLMHLFGSHIIWKVCYWSPGVFWNGYVYTPTPD